MYVNFFCTFTNISFPGGSFYGGMAIFFSGLGFLLIYRFQKDGIFWRCIMWLTFLLMVGSLGINLCQLFYDM